MSALASSLLAWLLTYLIHSTVLLGIAWFVTRRRRLEPAASDLLWKVALLASLMTGTIQSRLELSTPAPLTLPVATLPQAARPNEPAGATVPERKPGAARSLRDLCARAGALQSRCRAAAQHAGARARTFGSPRFPVARRREPDRAVLLFPAAQPAGAPRARDDGRIPERRVGHAKDRIRRRAREMSGHGGRVDSGVAAGRAGGGPGRTALVPGLPHRPPAPWANALEPRL